MKNTNWSAPKTTIFSAILDLRSCLQSGYKCRLTRLKNEDCQYPIMENISETDIRNYKFSSGSRASYNQIMNSNMSEFRKELSLKYKAVFGTPEAKERYYEKGILTEDNMKGHGTCHLVKIADIVDFYEAMGNKERADLFRNRLSESEPDKIDWVDYFDTPSYNERKIKSFRRKLWVVETLKDSDNVELSKSLSFVIWILNKVLFPMKYIPKKSVLRMEEYTIYTFRVGGITNGFAVEFQMPKKFDFR